MVYYDSINQTTRASLLDVWFKKAAYTGTDMYLSFYSDDDPASEVASISRRLVAASAWTRTNVSDDVTRMSNNAVISIGPLGADVVLSGYLFTSAAAAGTGIIAMKFATGDFTAKTGATLRIPAGAISIDLVAD